MMPLRGPCLRFHHQPLSRSYLPVFFSPIYPPLLFSFHPICLHRRVSNSTHNLPEAGVVLVGLLVEALLLRDTVLGVDEAAAVGQERELLAWDSKIVRRIIVRHDDRQLDFGAASAMRAVARGSSGRREARSRRGEAYAILNCCRWSLGGRFRGVMRGVVVMMSNAWKGRRVSFEPQCSRFLGSGLPVGARTVVDGDRRPDGGSSACLPGVKVLASAHSSQLMLAECLDLTFESSADSMPAGD